jgi:hypothetical protein
MNLEARRAILFSRQVAPLFEWALGRIRLLGAATPSNACEEREALVGVFSCGRGRLPHWTYALSDTSDVEETLLRWADPLDAAAGSVEELHAERARELALEARMIGAMGSAELGPLAERRYASGRAIDDEADDVARAWSKIDVKGAAGADAEDLVRTDGRQAGSLVRRLEDEISRRGLPFEVRLSSSLTALAATGDSVILVAPGRFVTRRVVERTVLHEVEGHVLPRCRARTLDLSFFRIGSARGIDEQEGMALVLEERLGYLDAGRRRELALRHISAQAMSRGADFVEIVHTLTRDFGLDVRDAVVMAERVYRGGDGTHRGLGREQAYLRGWTRIRRWLRESSEDEAVLRCGQLACHAAPRLREFIPEETRASAVATVPWKTEPPEAGFTSDDATAIAETRTA